MRNSLISKIMIGLLAAQLSMAGQEGGGTHGGNGRVAAFRAAAKKAAEIIEAKQLPINVDLKKFRTYIEKIENVGTTKNQKDCLIDGMQKDACSILSKSEFSGKILIVENRWDSLNWLERIALAFHEYLVQMGIEKNNDTHLSDELLSAMIDLNKSGELDSNFFETLSYLFSDSKSIDEIRIENKKVKTELQQIKSFMKTADLNDANQKIQYDANLKSIGEYYGIILSTGRVIDETNERIKTLKNKIKRMKEMGYEHWFESLSPEATDAFFKEIYKDVIEIGQ